MPPVLRAYFADLQRAERCFLRGGMLIGVLFLVDRFKRKTIIIYGFAIMATLHLIIAAVDYTLVGDLKATAIWLLGALFVGVMQGSMGLITWWY